jgi:hypothetical protein
MCFVVRSFGP